MPYARPAGSTPIAIGGIGPAMATIPNVGGNAASHTMDAAGESLVFYGHWYWEDQGSHTIDTSGSSKFIFRTGAITFANGGTTLLAGIVAMDTANGPPARAVNDGGTPNLITFGGAVCTMTTGGGNTPSANNNQSKVPTGGTSTIAHGDLVGFAIQMTARGGSDSIIIQGGASTLSAATQRLPAATRYTTVYADAGTSIEHIMAIASDGTRGWFIGTSFGSGGAEENVSTSTTPDEIGNTFQLPFPAKLCGAQLWIDVNADFDVVLYSDPLGTPSAVATVSVDANILAAATRGLINIAFPAPPLLSANAKYALVVKPTTTTNNGIWVFTESSIADLFSAGPLGDKQVYVSRADAGSFSETATKRAAISMILSHIDVGPYPTGSLGV